MLREHNTQYESVQDDSTVHFGDSFLNEALFLAEQGMAVFPCSGKEPTIPGGRGCLDATTDLKTIRKWWNVYPGSNIGVATGPASGFWVLDIDGPEGEKTLAELEAKHGRLPDTSVSLTGGGGRHLLFRYNGDPIKNRIGDLGPGLDTRAKGGYIIAPPSKHPDNGNIYEWEDGVIPDGITIADAPQWLIDLVCGPNKKQRERAKSAKADDKAQDSASTGTGYYQAAMDGECREVARTIAGSRNHRLNVAAFKLGGYVAGGHLKRSDVEKALLGAAKECGYVKEHGEAAALATIASGLNGGIAAGPKSAPDREPKTQTGNGKANGSTKQEKRPASRIRLETVDDVIRTFNPKYAVVNESGKVVIYCPKRDEQLQRDVIERIAFEDFRRMYMNIRIKVGVSKKGADIYEDVGTVWLENYDRRQYLGGVVMDPANRAPDDCWNLWRGFQAAPVKGDWSLMREHIRKVLCGGDENLFNYVLGWLARMVQKPDKQGEVALVMRGNKGTGKGTLGKWLVRLLGQHSLHISHAKHLVGNFNGHLRDAVFVFADEAFFAGDKAHEGVLKALVTEPVMTIEAKHQNAVTIANMTHIIMASNNDWVVPASSDERRFCVMDVSEEHMQDIPYFTALDNQMESGGLGAMLYDLIDMDISEFNVRQVPKTRALADQKRLSLDSLHRWWSTVLERGFVWRSRYGAPIFLQWSEFVSTELLHRSYQQWCSENREGRPMSREQLGTMMKKMYQSTRPNGAYPIYEVESVDIKSPQPAAMKDRPTGYTVGPLKTSREAFSKNVGVSFDWGDESD